MCWYFLVFLFLLPKLGSWVSLLVCASWLHQEVSGHAKSHVLWCSTSFESRRAERNQSLHQASWLAWILEFPQLPLWWEKWRLAILWGDDEINGSSNRWIKKPKPKRQVTWKPFGSVQNAEYLVIFLLHFTWSQTSKNFVEKCYNFILWEKYFKKIVLL